MTSRQYAVGGLQSGTVKPHCSLLTAHCLLPTAHCLLLLMWLSGCAAWVPFTVHQQPERAILIEDASVLNVETGAVTAHRDVLIVDGFVEEITAPGRVVRPPSVLAIPGGGATVVPGLIDMHVHLGTSSAPAWKRYAADPSANLRAFLYCGVTSVLDAGSLATDSVALRDKVIGGLMLGPHVYAAGPMMTAPGGHPLPLFHATAPWWARWYLGSSIAVEIGTPEDARGAVAQLASQGADFVKLVVDSVPAGAPHMTREVLRAAVQEAHARDLRAIAHIGTLQDAIDAAEAHVDAWMHPVYKERIPDTMLPVLARYQIPMVSTLAVFDGFVSMGRERRVATPLETETVSRDVLESFNHVPDEARTGMLGQELAAMRAHSGVWTDNVRRLHRAGVTILAGSDAQMGVFPGAGLHRELQLLVDAGFTPVEAIRAATLDAARFLANHRTPDFGRVAVGQRADLLLVDGDPTEDIGALSRIRVVIKNGMLINRERVAS